VNGPLLGHTWRSQRLKLAVVSIGLLVWGFVLPVVYGAFGIDFRGLFESGIIPEQFASFGGGDIFSLSGAIALGFIHPITIILVGVFAVGFATSSIAGERQRGTLEVLLARPVARRTVYVTLLVSTVAFVAVTIAAFLLGGAIGAGIAGVADELALDRLPALWLNGVLLYASFAAIGLAASVSTDRLTPALGVTLALLVVMYFFDVLGSLWPDAEFLQPWSLFHYLQAKAVLTGDTDLLNLGLLAVVCVAGIAYALAVFPRRDLAAPS
jgi:ABC-2 type transport system permease protein